MAQTALLTLDAVNAATARAWLQEGHKVFNEVTGRLLEMAGLKKRKATRKTNDAKANRRALHAQMMAMGAGRST